MSKTQLLITAAILCGVVLFAHWMKERYYSLQYRRPKDVLYYKLLHALEYIIIGMLLAIAVAEFL